MYLAYSLLLYLLLPAVLLRLWYKGRKLPAYRRHWSERFGYTTQACPGVIWLHAVSVGEVRAAATLLAALRVRDPRREVLVTVTTPSGRDMVVSLLGERVHCRYLPYDLPAAGRRFLDAWRPSVAIFLERELWPNLYASLAARAIPLYLVNARLNVRSLAWYRRFPALMRPTLNAVRRVAAQSEGDRQRLVSLGMAAERISVSGNLKFAARLPQDFSRQVARLKARLQTASPLWIAASTHPGEETLLLQAHTLLRRQFPQARLLLAPRHPERAAGLLAQCRALAPSCELSSAAAASTASVVLVDELGLLLAGYALADVAFVGGTLVAAGGHNPLEALMGETPVVVGPCHGNFAELYRQLQSLGSVQTAVDATEVALQVGVWLADPKARARAVEAAQVWVEENRQVLQRVLQVIGAPPDYR